MARKDIYTVIKTGREQSIDENFIELYAAAASASAAIAALQSGAGAAWTGSWTPTILPDSGTFTSVSGSGGYLDDGKTTTFTLTITIVTAGTAAGNMRFALPVGTANRTTAVVAAETSTGVSGSGVVLSGTTVVDRVREYDGTTFIATGRTIIVTGVYEKQ